MRTKSELKSDNSYAIRGFSISTGIHRIITTHTIDCKEIRNVYDITLLLVVGLYFQYRGG